MANRYPGPTPNRWLHCPRKSELFIVDKFLAFKTPLNQNFKDQIPLKCTFTPEMIFEYTKLLKVKLGLWIDLTNTKRFYDRREIEDRDCKYFKIQCRGHGVTPSIEQTQSFIELVDDFIRQKPLDMVGVHCTHGFNRTGFMIISYMVEKMDWSVEAALNAFAEARPPGIYKADYIKELFQRYDDIADAPDPPPLPDWCFDEEDVVEEIQPLKRPYSSTDNGNLEDDQETNSNDKEQSGSNPKKKKRREIIKKDAVFMKGVSGVELFLNKPRLEELHTKVQGMCNWKSSGFPGSQPVSMTHTNLKYLHEKPYRVSWKADGTRYMMLIEKEKEIYFFDRDFSCFLVNGITFPCKDNERNHLTDTLLDGEMVIDKFNGQFFPRYLVYDIIYFNGEDVKDLSFYKERCSIIKTEIIEPRYNAMKKGIINRCLEPFGVRDKEFWDISMAEALLSPKFAKKLCHEPDGLIFQPALEPYKSGACMDVLKWKPLSLNSVDFRLKISRESGEGILTRKIGLLFVGGADHPFDQIKYTKALMDYDNKIIECKIEDNKWVFMRERKDKSYPNSYDTAMAVMNSIRNPVTTKQLLDFIKAIPVHFEPE